MARPAPPMAPRLVLLPSWSYPYRHMPPAWEAPCTCMLPCPSRSTMALCASGFLSKIGSPAIGANELCSCARPPLSAPRLPPAGSTTRRRAGGWRTRRRGWVRSWSACRGRWRGSRSGTTSSRRWEDTRGCTAPSPYACGRKGVAVRALLLTALDRGRPVSAESTAFTPPAFPSLPPPCSQGRPLACRA